MERLLTWHTVTGKDQPPTEPGEDLSCCAEGGLVGSSGHAIAGPSWAVEDDCCDFGDNTFQVLMDPVVRLTADDLLTKAGLAREGHCRREGLTGASLGINVPTSGHRGA